MGDLFGNVVCFGVVDDVFVVGEGIEIMLLLCYVLLVLFMVVVFLVNYFVVMMLLFGLCWFYIVCDDDVVGDIV